MVELKPQGLSKWEAEDDEAGVRVESVRRKEEDMKGGWVICVRPHRPVVKTAFYTEMSKRSV